MSSQDLRVVLLGRTGVGKSSLGNTLLGKDVFRVETSFASVTFKCQWEQADRFGTLLQVTDTPGVSDTGRPEAEVLKEIGKSIALAAPGPHVVLMVLRCDRRFTEEEYEAYQTLKRLFGDGIRNHMIVVFVGADSLGNSKDECDQALARAMRTAPGTLREVIADAGGRFCSVNNRAQRAERDQQAESIVKVMLELLSQNGDAHFTSNLCDTVNQRVASVVQSRLDTHRDESHEAALAHTRQDIVQDKADPGFFEWLVHIVRDTMMRVIVAKKACDAVLSKCSVM